MLHRALLVTVSLALAACQPKCPEPQYEGKASDEAWLTMIDGEDRATADAMKGPQLGTADGAALPASPAPTFQWSSTLISSAPRRVPAPSPRPSHPLRGLFISEAWAHLPPVTGAIFWFKIAVPGEACPVEVLSTRTEYTPTEGIWATLKKGTGPRTITGISAYLTDNRITEGPFKMPSPVTFTVTP